MTIVNDDSRVITKLETSLTDDARVVIYNRHMFIVQATAHFQRLNTGHVEKLTKFPLYLLIRAPMFASVPRIISFHFHK
jgi:hypothetical protein